MVEMRGVVRRLLVALCLGVVFVAGAQAEEGELAVQLDAKKVITSEQGKESFDSAESAQPGDVIEYTATYSNGGQQQLQNIKPVLPIPVGMTFMPDSATPQQVLASVDGQLFQPIPLMEKIVSKDGKVETKAVPLDRYRYLRWSVPTLAPGKQFAIKARARVASSEDSASNTLTKSN